MCFSIFSRGCKLLKSFHLFFRPQRYAFLLRFGISFAAFLFRACRQREKKKGRDKKRGCVCTSIVLLTHPLGGKTGIQTLGTDKPFTGFRVRPIRSLWHLSLELRGKNKEFFDSLYCLGRIFFRQPIVFGILPVVRRSSSLDDALDVVQFVQGLQWGEVVHIQVQDFISDLAQHRVVQLEETELYAFLGGR